MSKLDFVVIRLRS